MSFPGEAVDERSQRLLVHRLPTARLVDRTDFVTERVRGRHVIHVGFADAGYRSCHQDRDEWLHLHLAEAAGRLVGIDIDAVGVEEAVLAGLEAHVADCCDPGQLRALHLEAAEVVVAGEIIEHLDNPGGFLDGLHELCSPGGEVVMTTPNAYGWVNPAAALAGYEVNHPDHIVMYTWRTLSKMLERHGWEVVETATYVPKVRATTGGGIVLRAFGLAARVLLGVQRLVARWWAPFVADGLIVVARPVLPDPRRHPHGRS